MIEALTYHRGEIARNPYHLRLLSWLADSVRRGGKAVFEAGTHPPSFAYGALYHLARWEGGVQTAIGRPVAIASDGGLQSLLETMLPCS